MFDAAQLADTIQSLEETATTMREAADEVTTILNADQEVVTCRLVDETTAATIRAEADGIDIAVDILRSVFTPSTTALAA